MHSLWRHRANSDRIDIEHARVVIFSHFSDRCGDKLLHTIKECLDRESLEIGHLILTTYNERRSGLTRIGIYDQALTKPGITG